MYFENDHDVIAYFANTPRENWVREFKTGHNTVLERQHITNIRVQRIEREEVYKLTAFSSNQGVIYSQVNGRNGIYQILELQVRISVK